jgi:hypothetical protein
MNLRDFRVGWRLLLQQPAYSIVVTGGLAIGFAAYFLPFGFVAFCLGLRHLCAVGLQRAAQSARDRHAQAALGGPARYRADGGTRVSSLVGAGALIGLPLSALLATTRHTLTALRMQPALALRD